MFPDKLLYIFDFACGRAGRQRCQRGVMVLAADARALVQSAARENGIDRLLKEYDVDALVSPSVTVRLLAHVAELEGINAMMQAAIDAAYHAKNINEARKALVGCVSNS